jgi:ribosomal protein L11 methyltransferase
MSPLWRVSVAVENADAAAAASAALGDLCGAVSAFEDGDGAWRVDGLANRSPDRARLEANLALAFAGAAVPVFALEKMAERDWLAENQASFPPLHVGLFFVHGSHVPLVPAGAVGIEIDAATAFGSGEHGSTQGCLLALDRLARRIRPRRILDLGAGTGILAIAAAKLWRRPVLAADLDAEAVRVTALNARRNRVAALVYAVRADSHDRPAVARGGPYDLVLANILARPLMRLARGLDRVLAPGGIAVLAGLLPRQEAMVLAAHRSAGLNFVARLDVAGWRTLILTKRKSE